MTPGAPQRSPVATVARRVASGSFVVSGTSSRCAGRGRSREVAREGCALFGVDELGLDRLDRALLDALRALRRQRRSGCPRWRTASARRLRRSRRSTSLPDPPGASAPHPRGRVATDRAFAHLGVARSNGRTPLGPHQVPTCRAARVPEVHLGGTVSICWPWLRRGRQVCEEDAPEAAVPLGRWSACAASATSSSCGRASRRHVRRARSPSGSRWRRDRDDRRPRRDDRGRGRGPGDGLDGERHRARVPAPGDRPQDRVRDDRAC